MYIVKMTNAFVFHLLLSSLWFYWKFISLNWEKKGKFVSIRQFKEPFEHIAIRNCFQSIKNIEAEYKDIYKSPYNFSCDFDKEDQPKNYMYTKLFEIFIP